MLRHGCEAKPVTASAQAIVTIGGDWWLSQGPGPPGSSAASPHPANARKPLPRSVPGQDHLLLSLLHSRRGQGTKGGAQLGLTVLAIVSLLFLRHPIRLLGFLSRVLSFSPHPPSQSAAKQPPNEASWIVSPSGDELALAKPAESGETRGGGSGGGGSSLSFQGPVRPMLFDWRLPALEQPPTETALGLRESPGLVFHASFFYQREPCTLDFLNQMQPQKSPSRIESTPPLPTMGCSFQNKRAAAVVKWTWISICISGLLPPLELCVCTTARVTNAQPHFSLKSSPPSTTKVNWMTKSTS